MWAFVLRKWELIFLKIVVCFSKMGVCFFENGSLFYENGSLFCRKWEFVFSCVTCSVTCLIPAVAYLDRCLLHSQATLQLQCSSIERRFSIFRLKWPFYCFWLLIQLSSKVFYLAMFLRYVSMLDYDPVSLLKTINLSYSIWLMQTNFSDDMHVQGCHATAC